MEEARPAAEADLAHLARLALGALEEMGPLRGGRVFLAREARAVPVEGSLREALDDPDRTLWVGTIDQWPVGYAVGRVETLRTGEVHGVIEDLYVEPEARGVGVGEALIDGLVAWFAQRGCAGVDAHALPGDRETKNFFETAGFTARLLVMHHRLAP